MDEDIMHDVGDGTFPEEIFISSFTKLWIILVPFFAILE